jgi:predicted dehydrogenase
MNISRRNFLKSSSAAVATIAVPSLVNAAQTRVSASDKVNVALIGCRNMGWANLQDFLIHPEVQCVALCDVDKTVLDEKTGEVEKLRGKKPDQYGDYRKILERKDVDIVIIGTPDHWHCLHMVDSCAAGKDVYVEKPASNSIAECDAMVAAAKKYNRVVQVGQQQRSAKHWQEMIEYIRSGKLGTVGHAHVWANFNYAAIPQRVPDSPVPDGVDFDVWTGPSPKVSFNRQRFHGLWRMFWNYGGGLLTDWGVHLLDMALWGLDVRTMPKKTVSTGGNFFYPDGAQETYDSQTVSWLFDNAVMSWEHNAGAETGPYNRNYGVLFRGTNGTLVANRDSWEIYPEWDRRTNSPKLPETLVKADHQDHKAHVNNFLECVKTRNKQTACTIENGSLCAKYAHLGNIAARLGGVSLHYDDSRKRFTDCAEANKFLKPQYRSPWKFPEIS